MYGKREISKKNITDNVSGLDLFEYYCTPFKKLNDQFCSELRDDKVPSCAVYVVDGKVFYKDFATDEFYDSMGYIGRKFNISFLQTLALINRDFNLGFYTSMEVDRPAMEFFGVPNKRRDLAELEKGNTYIKVQRKAWTKEYDAAYWKEKYDATVKQLEFFDIYPIAYFWINNRVHHCKPNAYAYYFGKDGDREIWKIYQPLADRAIKWFSNTNRDILQGYSQLPDKGDLLFIASSLKDVVVLRKAGYFAIAPASENTLISDDLLNELKGRFTNIIVFYDNDEPGIRASQKHSEAYGVQQMCIPTTAKVKDPSDFVDEYSYSELKVIIEQNKKQLYG